MSSLNKISTQAIGKHTEKIALRYLKRQGLKYLAKNFHSRFGEIDLIMKDQDTLVFVEVRYRQPQATVSAIESIAPHKINKIRKTAQSYLLSFDSIPPCRFDVIAMTHKHAKSGYTIDWIKNVF